jgi:DNA topoisomerase-1
VVRARFQVVKENGETFRPNSKEQTDAALEKLDARDFAVSNREDRPTSTKPGAPYITSTLQQSASTRLGFSVKKTMTLAQRLYEAGYITYMRTDSTNLSTEAVDAARALIKRDYGDLYLPDDPIRYASKEAAQEAHEAIRPSNVTTRPEQLSDMDRDAVRLYEMIWRQFVACQMPRAQYTSTTITVSAGEFELKLRGRILRFDGHTRVQPTASRSDDDTEVPDLQVGEAMRLLKLDPFQHFTKPPARFGEASLVRELEKRGIGRPSTYAAIIQTIQDRGYVRLENRRFHAEKIGEIVTERLVENFENLLNYDFTAEMEERLDEVADGEKAWKQVLDEFYADFVARMESAEEGMRPNAPVETDIECPECGRAMQLRTASTGVFLGCSGYQLPPKERCTKTLNLIPGDEAVDLDADEESESKALRRKRRCPKCATSMDSYLLDEKRKLHVCGNSPDCGGIEVEAGEFRIKGYEGPTLECDKCGSEMQLKTGRFGKYFGCTSETCKNTRKLLRNGEPAPPKMDPVPMPELECEKVDDTYVLRDGAAGLFLAASQFPKNRETRAPLVSEIKPHKDEIDPKYAFLFEAPEFDPDGNPAVIRWSRKLKEQYLMSEKDGKATGWRAVWRDGAWQQDEAATTKKGGRRKAPAKKKAAPKKKAAAR